jgi:hypothetical protein
MRSWIHFSRGRFVRQARVGLGDLREEHLSRHGFQGPVAMLYRTDGPNEIVRVEGDYRARAVDSADIVAPDADHLPPPHPNGGVRADGGVTMCSGVDLRPPRDHV